MKWITTDDLGVIAFRTRAEAAKAVPSFRQVRCSFSLGFAGWLAVDPYGNDTLSTIQTPDGRKIPVVSGWTEGGRVMGMRGSNVLASYSEAWRIFMGRAIEQGLALHVHQQS